MRTVRACLFLLLVSHVSAGANGGRVASRDAFFPEPDAGPSGTDAGPLAIDTGMVGRDSGTIGSDSGIGNDSGTIGNDSGTIGNDSGTIGNDSGMPMRDVGPQADAFSCTSAAQCSDGLACNGVERCNAGACTPGTAIVCDDGIPCTVDSCVEPGGTCTFVPNNAACPTGQTCSATLGCRPTTTCSESPCRLLSPQCGCTAGQACYPNGATRVCAAVGTGTGGMACATNSDCAATYACTNFSTGATPANMCARLCATDSECSGGLCFYTVSDGAGGTVPGVMLCTRPCDPVNQTGCAAGAACDIFRERTGAMRLFTDCTAPRGVLGQFQTCTVETDCRPGFACINSDGLGLACHHWCRYPGGACFGGGTCTDPFVTPTIIGGVRYGLCN